MCKMLHGNNDDHLLRNVQDLRKRLQVTQRNLQQITAWEDTPPPISVRSRPDRFSSSTPLPQRSPLGVDDIDFIPRTNQSNGQTSSNDVIRDVRLMTPVGKSPASFTSTGRRTPSMPYTRSVDTSADYDPSDLRRKLQLLREDNSGLVSNNNRLQSHVEELDYQLLEREGQVKSLVEQIETQDRDDKQETAALRERLTNLQAEAKVQDQTIREVESRYEHSQRLLECTRDEHREVLRLVSSLRQQLISQENLSKKLEQERDAEILNLDLMRNKFHEYQSKMKDKIKKMQTKEKSLTEESAEFGRSNSLLSSRIDELQTQLLDLREELSRHQAELSQTKDANDEYQRISADLRNLVQSQKSQIGKLQTNLDQSHLSESELRSLTNKQRDKLEKYKTEVTASKQQITQLESWARNLGHQQIRKARANSIGSDSGIGYHRNSPSHTVKSRGNKSHDRSRDQSFGSEVISPDGSPLDNDAMISELRFQLAMKEAEVTSLRAVHSGEDIVNSSLANDLNHSHATSRRVLELENDVTRLEEERTNHKFKISQLETRISDLDNELNNKVVMLRHRNDDVTDLQNDVSNKNTNLLTMEKELRRKESRLSALDRQMEEKTCDYSDQKATVRILREELAVKTTTVGELRGQLDGKTHELIEHKSMSETVQTLHRQQCDQYEQQIQLIQNNADERCEQVIVLESRLVSSQSECDHRHETIHKLENDLHRYKQTLEDRAHLESSRLEELEKRNNQSTHHVTKVEEALVVCRDDMQICMDQLTEEKLLHDQQIDDKKHQILELESGVMDVENRHRELVHVHQELEEAYDRQEVMLAGSASRLHELEDSQAQLQHQLSLREKEVVVNHDIQSEQLESLHNKLRLSLQDLNDRGKHNQQLMELIEDLESEKKGTNEKLSSHQLELDILQMELTEKDTAVTDIERKLDLVTMEKDKQRDKVYELEEKYHQTESDCDKHKQTAKQLDQQLNKLQAEDRKTHDQLSQLQSLLTTSQIKVSEQSAEINDLQDSLRDSQCQTSQRSELWDQLEQSLKDRTWQLEQLRSSQLTEFDISIKDQRNETESKVHRLEDLLEQRQDDLDRRVDEINDLLLKVTGLQRNSQSKDLEVQRHQINLTHVTNQLEEKCQRIVAIETQLEDLKSLFDELKTDKNEIQQELRLSREQLQREHSQISDSRRIWSGEKREQDRIVRQLDDTLALVQNKELDSARLAEELGTIRAHQAQVESRGHADVRKLRQEMIHMKEQHQLQLVNLREDHTSIISSKDELTNQHRLHVCQLQESISSLKLEMTSLVSKNCDLENEYHDQNSLLEETSQSSFIKEAEIARLQSKIQNLQHLTYHDSPNNSLHQSEADTLTKQPHPTDSTNRLATVYCGLRPRSTSPTHKRLSDISKLSEFVDFPTLSERLDYLDIDDRRMSFSTKLFPKQTTRRQSKNSILSSSKITHKNESESESRRESRSDFSGIFTASESEGDDDKDSFVVMLQEVNYRFNKNRQDPPGQRSEERAVRGQRSGELESELDESKSSTVIRVPSQFDDV